jgi:hypothetical protein
MDADPGKHRLDLAELNASLCYGNTSADAASMLCRDEIEVREKARQPGSTE